MFGVNIDETSSNGCNFLKGTIFGENARKRAHNLSKAIGVIYQTQIDRNWQKILTNDLNLKPHFLQT